MLVLHDEATRLHKTVELLGSKFEKALECPERIEAILSHLQKTESHSIRFIDAAGKETEGANPSGSPSLLSRLLSETHGAEYLEHLRTTHSDWLSNGLIEEAGSVFPECFLVPGLSRPGAERGPPKDRFARPGYFAFDMSSGISKDTWKSACASANLAIVATRLTIVPESTTEKLYPDILALCRPPGHHCTTKLAGGYCYINNAVVAVQSVRHFLSVSQGMTETSKIAILDLDFHHGNGTQGYFYDDSSVLYVSIHGKDEYPYYSGFEDETGEKQGEGFNLNLPLAAESSVEIYLEKLEFAVRRLQEFKPSYLIVSLGFDTFRLDPIGRFDLDTDDYEVIARKVREADGLRDIPSVILLEGGYVVDKLGENMLKFLEGWESVRG